MGALYLAVTGDTGLERLLVIKTVLPHLADKEYIARFRDEAKVVVKLSHGNLIPVFDAGQVEGELFMAMDFIEGKDLRAVWNQCAHKGVAFPVPIAVYLVKELCRGLGYAHSFGGIHLIHRDISPPNVILSYAGEVKLTDFGLASSTLKLEKTAPGIIYGKVAYMSPEQARGDSLDKRSDLYAAGIILWELLTGRQLFLPGETQPKDLLQRARNPVVDPPSSRASRVPKELDEICLRALFSNREERYESGEEFRDVLGGWLAAEAPATDEAGVEKFLHQLFAENIVKEREERSVLFNKTRRRIKTLPPSHELRKMLEESESSRVSEQSWGRRSADHGDPAAGRRAEDRDQKVSAQGAAAVGEVPQVEPGGRTIVQGVTTKSSAHQAVAKLSDPLSSQRDLVGSVLDGRYEIHKLIGEGGMGRVYLAEHIEIGKQFAVKVLHQVYNRMPNLVERFRQEARAASKIGHPNIVEVTDSGLTEDGAAYFVMEYLQGVELASILDREGALAVPRSLGIAAQICRTLAAAHAVGIIHRDLKPENIFLTVREGSSDFVKVLDFGIAKSTEAEEAQAKRLTHPGMAMGTPEYMAPEQAAGKSADRRCDVYAVGAILYEMLTGTPPYSGDNFMEILTKKATVEPESPLVLRPELSDVVADLVMKAMAREADDRLPSMEAFEYELTKCMSGRGAAVAKILGMRGLPSGQLGVAASTSELASVAKNTARTAAQAAFFSDSDPASEQWSDQTAVVAEFSSRPRLGALALLGRLSLVLLICGAVGVMVFVAFGEKRGNRRSRPLEELPSSSEGVARATSAEARAGGGVVVPSTRVVEKERGDPLPAVQEPAGGEKSAVLAAAEAGEQKDAGDLKDGGERKEDGGAVAPSPQMVEESRAPPPPRTTRLPARKSVSRPRGAKKSSSRRVVGRAKKAPTSRAAAEVLIKKARKFEKSAQWRRAEAAYRRITRGRHYRARALVGLAKISFERKRWRQAVRRAEAALENGGGISARRILANSHYRAKHYKKAIQQFELLLKKRPKDGQARRTLAKAKKALGK